MSKIRWEKTFRIFKLFEEEQSDRIQKNFKERKENRLTNLKGYEIIYFIWPLLLQSIICEFKTFS